MYRNLTREQRSRLIVRQASPEWKADLERRMDVGIEAGTHAVCDICGHKGRKAEPAYDICMNCWHTPTYAKRKAEVIVRVQAGGAS